MGILGNDDALVIFAFFISALDQRLFVCAGGRNRKIKHLGDCRSLRPLIGRSDSREIVRRNSALLVGRPGKRDHGSPAPNKILDIHHVPYSVY